MLDMETFYLIKWSKNILILGLAVFCVFQTLRLWFDDMPSLSLFGNMLGFESAPNHAEALSNLARPKRLLASGDGAAFICLHSNITETEQFISARKAISALFHSGGQAEVFEGAEIDWPSYFTGDTLVLDYGFPMPITAFAAAFGNSQAVINPRIGQFDMIFFIPWDGGNKVVFADTLSETQIVGEIIISGATPIVYGVLDDWQNLLYMVSFPAYMGPGSPVFIPQSGYGGLAFIQGRLFGLLERREDYVVNTRNVMSLLDPFFDNPAAVRREYKDGEFVFSDAYTSARYRSDHYIKYRNWRERRGRDTGSFEAAYAEAVTFMLRDTSIGNEYYLEGYKHEGGTFTFYFNYIFEDFPVMLDQRFGSVLDISSCIEITVEKGRVSEYKRFAMELHPVILGFTSRPEISGQAVFNELRFQGWEGAHAGYLNSMDLVYLLYIGEQMGHLNYDVEYAGASFIFPVRE